MKKIAFIGSGIMGTALATAACKGIDPNEVVIVDVVKDKAKLLSKQLKCNCVETNSEAVESSKYIVFCVKPQYLDGVLEEVSSTFQKCIQSGQEKIIVTIVAGIDSKTYIEKLNIQDKKVPIIRMLPNTACLIGKGYTLIMEDDSYSKEQLEEFKYILKESGGFDSLSPSQFVAGTVLTSTSPAFIAMFANSLADGGVYNGLLRHQARRYALEGILGTVQLLLQSDKHIEELKDNVCSPAGPAMIGVKSLEDSGFRSSIINAVVDSYNRFSEMGKVK